VCVCVDTPPCKDTHCVYTTCPTLREEGVCVQSLYLKPAGMWPLLMR
jgi:hypothetical protein